MAGYQYQMPNGIIKQKRGLIIMAQRYDTYKSADFANAVRNGDKQVAQITFNDDIIKIVAAMLEEKTEFVQMYFANPDFQNFVNARVFQAAVSQLTIG